jgi:hypothetical protein
MATPNSHFFYTQSQFRASSPDFAFHPTHATRRLSRGPTTSIGTVAILTCSTCCPTARVRLKERSSEDSGLMLPVKAIRSPALKLLACHGRLGLP